MYKMKSDIKFSLTHEMLENAENERIHTSYAQEKAILECVSNGDIHALENTYYSLPTTVYGKMTSSNSKLKLLFYASIAIRNVIGIIKLLLDALIKILFDFFLCIFFREF